MLPESSILFTVAWWFRISTRLTGICGTVWSVPPGEPFTISKYVQSVCKIRDWYISVLVKKFLVWKTICIYITLAPLTFFARTFVWSFPRYTWMYSLSHTICLQSMMRICICYWVIIMTDILTCSCRVFVTLSIMSYFETMCPIVYYF